MIVAYGLPWICAFALFGQDEPAPRKDPTAIVAPDRESGQKATPATDANPPSPGDGDLLKALEKQSAPSEVDGNPLDRVGDRMRDVQGRLAKSDPGSETQTLQKEIVDDLDQLIEQLKKGGACPTCGSASCSSHGKQKRQTSNSQAGQQSKPSPTGDPKEGTVTARPGAVSDEQKAANARVVRAVWGHLPDKLREEMQQAFQDSGLPKYRPLIEQYFRAIAEQTESRK